MVKAISNRFRRVIDKSIDEAQNAFVPGRLISDNVLLAYEILHSLKQKRLGKNGFMAVKLDMSKAYDRVEWNFVGEVLIRMGFVKKWIEAIMKCMSTVSYTTVVNRFAGEIFYPTRGLRQGDPLSLFLFLICREGLSSLLRLVVRDGTLKGVKSEEDRQLVVHQLGVRSSTDSERYLGLPSLVGKKKKASFQALKDRLKQRIDNWSIRYLSQGGKEVFIKAILQAIPTYSMACFLLPKSFCVEMEGIIAKFWWQEGRGKKGLHCCLDSLVARVLKAKYFPQSDFLKARLGIYLLLSGGAFGQQRAFSNMGFVGELAERLGSLYGTIDGFQDVMQWFVHERKNLAVRDLVKKIRSYLAELEGIRDKKPVSPTEGILSQERETTSIMVQFDAAFDKRNFRSASGLVVRDQQGERIVERVILHENISSSFIAEAHAGLEAVKLAIEMSLSSRKRTSIPEVSFQFIYRSKNVQAHNIAKDVLQRREGDYLVREGRNHSETDPEGRWREHPD
ncbi:uncharacterized protein LOC108455547 [Gossypium arboreum]|uniref:uncharacterized protein LOC108455547 n=1 Tax=Gossypium arboreum TaxID=29729 RepID=UPI0008197A4B|nr:uncharacterized protein LOC108455547 [Gossypium arboreum]